MTSVLERLNSTKKRSKAHSVTVTLGSKHLISALAVFVVIGASWGVGMRMGYVFAKKDVAHILETPNPTDSDGPPKWRAWADQNVAYTPPADLGMIFDLVGRTIPGTGGMTTGDIWNGYHDRLSRAFFQRQVKTPKDMGPALPAPSQPAATAAP